MVSPFKGSKPILLWRHDQCMSQEWLWILACCFALNMKPSIRNNSMTYNTYCRVNGLRENWKHNLIKCMPYKSSTYLRQHLVPPKAAWFWLSPTDINCTTSSTQPLRVGVPSSASPMYGQQTTQPSARNTATLSSCPPSGPRQQKTSSRMESNQRGPRFPRNMPGRRDPYVLSSPQKRNLGIIIGSIWKYFIWIKYTLSLWVTWNLF